MKLAALFGLVVLASVAACADGTDIEDGAGGAGGDPSGVGGSTSETTSTTTTVSTSSSSGGGEGGMGEGGMGGAGEGGAGGSVGTGGNTCDFTSPNGASNPLDLGDVKGEGGGPAIVHQDTTSKWVAVFVDETSSSIFEEDLGYRVTLASPAGTDYDVYVHLGQQGGGLDCFVTPTKGTGTPEAVAHGWDDEQGIGGEDDSAWLCIEVRHVSGDVCTDPWTLTVIGTG